MGMFPISDNLFSLMFTVQADLTEQQRERLTSHMTLRGIDVQNYTFDLIREAFIELFCAPKSSIENPSFRVSGQGRNFCVLDYGDCEGSSGYWAMDEETGEEGFLEEYNEVFWTYDETNASVTGWYLCNQRKQSHLQTSSNTWYMRQ